MNPSPDALDAGGDPVDQFRREFQFLSRVTAGCQGCSHEGSPLAVLRHDDFGENRFVKLDKVATGVTQVDQLFPQDFDDIIRQFNVIAIDLTCQGPDPHGTGKQIRAGQGYFDQFL
jgi:hypothetical protein